MIHDLRSILDGWEYEPGKISVRKIIGRDGCEKIQTRVDLGLLQLEVRGRPDGAHPNGRDSMLEHCEMKLRAHLDRGGERDRFVLSPEECRELRHETHLYYQRFLSLFVLEEFESVERDTARNLRAIDFCRRYASTRADREALEPQRAYVLMMNARARVYGAMNRGQYGAALRGVEDGLRKLAEIDDESGDSTGERPEVCVLRNLHREIMENLPRSSAARLRWELEQAVENEEYERAAQLRDRLQQVQHAEPDDC